MDSTTRTVAASVAEAIEAQGQTQLGLAEATGIPRTTLLRRLSGATPFTVAELASIAGALGVEVTSFFVEATDRAAVGA